MANIYDYINFPISCDSSVKMVDKNTPIYYQRVFNGKVNNTYKQVPYNLKRESHDKTREDIFNKNVYKIADNLNEGKPIFNIAEVNDSRMKEPIVYKAKISNNNLENNSNLPQYMVTNHSDLNYKRSIAEYTVSDKANIIVSRKDNIEQTESINSFVIEEGLKNIQSQSEIKIGEVTSSIGSSKATEFVSSPRAMIGSLHEPISILENKNNLPNNISRDASEDVLLNLHSSEYISLDSLKLEPATRRGAFGVVFKGIVLNGHFKGTTVAVKRYTFDSECRMSEEHYRSLEREVYAYRCVRHPNICRYIGVCLEPGFYALITEYLEGGNLFDLLYENKIKVSIDIRLKIARQLCDAISYIHSRRLIHRDIKTANIVLDKNFSAKICDFGKTRTMDPKLPTPYAIILDENGGSPRYMAPECFYVGKVATDRADVWSVGCCLLEIFGGPISFFEHQSNDEVINAILVNKAIPKVPQWFHPDIGSLLVHCFQRKPEKRPTAAELSKKLKQICSYDLKPYNMDTRRDIDGNTIKNNNSSFLKGAPIVSELAKRRGVAVK